ncbi:hypothetical protein HAZT_HAZT001177 [Hyalella azteca]|uniref:BHLH domain-containing protein n=1 Tax=Hyalella azteca TaxID=294128 RepID=A0A6A0HB05_HYAAZ|nr:hypothetical protein HAZT_HAZT001177 [Hyalella azteca]
MSGGHPTSPVCAMENEKRIRREIANSNERRRMKSINAGFASLKELLPNTDGEKLSKVVCARARLAAEKSGRLAQQPITIARSAHKALRLTRSTTHSLAQLLPLLEEYSRRSEYGNSFGLNAGAAAGPHAPYLSADCIPSALVATSTGDTARQRARDVYMFVSSHCSSYVAHSKQKEYLLTTDFRNVWSRENRG